jgi:glutamine cyclotransferase
MAQQTSSLRAASRSKTAPSFATATSPRRRRYSALLLTFVVVAAGLGIWWLAFQPMRRASMQMARVVNSFPHDRNAWSQGLTVDEDGTLIEGTGLYRESTLRRVELETGRVLEKVNIDGRMFGEGVTVMGERIFQLTWREKTGIIYDRKTLREIGRFRLEGEGWGLTHDGTHLIVSDGSSTLTFLDPDTFAVVKRLRVTSGTRAVPQLNELEYVEGEIFANIWHQDYIVRIDPKTGRVTGSVDLSRIYPRRDRAHREHVLNGIAYDPAKKRLFVTGKNWPKLYEIEIIDAAQ